MPQSNSIPARTKARRYGFSSGLGLYGKFEYAVVLGLVVLLAVVILEALWSLALDIFFGLVRAHGFDPFDYRVFQSIFGRVFTVIIALEFKRSLLVAAAKRSTIVQARAVILIALLAVVRKLIILDLTATGSLPLLALAAATLALGAVYWLIRHLDRQRTGARKRRGSTPVQET